MLLDKLPNRDEVEKLLGIDAFAENAGMEVLLAEPGRADVRLPISPRVLNGHGNLHGGAMFTLADYAGAVASNMYGDATMAVNCTISFLNAVRGGYVTAKARTVKKGSRMNFLTVEIFDSEDRLVALFQGSAMQVRRKNPDNAATS